MHQQSIVGADATLGIVYRGVMPFVVADLLKLALLVVFPALALWLPSTMVGKWRRYTSPRLVLV